jgi:hypothetical protein
MVISRLWLHVGCNHIYATNGKISYMNNLQLNFSHKYGFSTNGTKKIEDENL